MEELLSTNGLIPHFSLSPYATSGNQFDQYKKMNETLAHGYSSESTQREQSNENQNDRV